MFKKIMLLISCFSIMTLVACGHARNEVNYVVAGAGEPVEVHRETNDEFEFTLEIGENDFDHRYEIDYAMLRGGFVTEGLTVVFNFNQPVYDFELFEIYEHASFESNGEFIFGSNVLAEFNHLAPTIPLVLTNYHGLGSFAASGFSFTTLDGARKDFSFVISPVNGELVWQPFERVEFDQDLIGIEVEGMMPEIAPIDIVTITRMELETDTEPFDFSSYLKHYNLDFIQIFNYDNVFFARLMAEENRMFLPPGDFLLIQMTTTIYDVAIISLETVEGDFQTSFQIVDTFEIADGFHPNEGLVIYNYLPVGMFPLSGITFTDEFGVQRHYLIFQDHSDEFPPYRLIPFVPYQN